MTPTWYSIRNHLEASLVEDNNKNLQFLASMVTAYPCLDIWFRSSGRDVELRVMYMQCNSGFFASDSWERNGEEPKVFQQLRGDWQSVRADLITLLPSLSRLSDDKRHGLANQGAKQPYEGGGLLFSVDGDGALILQGRYGAIQVEVNGAMLPFRAFNYDFNCCTPTVTIGPEWLGDFVIIDTPPGTNNGTRYTGTTVPPTPVAQLSLVSTDAVVFANPPLSPGVGGLGGVEHEWPIGTTFTVPQSGPSAIPLPVKINAQAQDIQNWPYLFGQGFCTLTANIADIPLISDTGSVKVYEKAGDFPFPRFTTTSQSCTITNPDIPMSIDTAYYQSFGTGANNQSGMYRVTVTEQGNNTKAVEVTFAPDNGNFSATILPSMIYPSGVSTAEAWASTNVDLGTRDVYSLYDGGGAPALGNADIFNVNLGLDTPGQNIVAQGDYPSASTTSNQLKARVWRSYLAVTT